MASPVWGTLGKGRSLMRLTPLGAAAAGVRWESDHLWLYLLALGLSTHGAYRSLQLGPRMFDRPNAHASAVVFAFLFAKLDVRRWAATFRHYSLALGNFTDPQLRKECCDWLKDIAKEKESRLPRVTPSSLISPGGHKFVHLLYRFARYVMTEDLKRISVGTGIPFAEAVKLRPKDMYMANARHRVAYNKLLQIFVKENLVIQEHEKKAQLLIKEIKQIKSEYAVLQMQSYKVKQNDRNNNDKIERIQTVRSMWALIDEMLTSLKKEKAVVDDVLSIPKDCVGQYTLDGSNVAFRVPRLLVHRVESDIHQCCTGNVYEAGKLNFLTVIQLLNEALRTLRDERCHYELKQFQVIENMITVCNKILQNLKARRLKIELQHSVSTSGSISREQEDWEVKWKSFLGLCPLGLTLEQNPDLKVALPFSPNPAEEEDSDFYQDLVSVSDSLKVLIWQKEDEGTLETVTDKSSPPPGRISAVPLESSKDSENGHVLIEKNLHIETCNREEKPVPPEILENENGESVTSEIWENAGDHVIQAESPVKKEDPLKKARDELAEQVAKIVMSESSQSGEGEGMPLEDLISALAFNPFLTRKQIPRTPENLLTGIRSSCGKAGETEGSSDVEMASTEVMAEEAPVDARPVLQEAADSRSVCSIPASPVPDFDPPLSESKFQSSSTELRPQEQMRISHTSESPILETSGMPESERTEEQDFKCVLLNKNSVKDQEEQTSPYVKCSTNIPGSSENSNRTDVLPSDPSRGSVTDRMLHWNVRPSLSSVSREATCLGILEETFPEELGNVDLNNSTSSGSDFDVINSSYLAGGSENKGDIKEFNTHKVLKKTASNSEEELHQTHNGSESAGWRSDLNLVPQKRGDELCSPPKLFCLDEEFTKMPSPIPLHERKYSLSSVIASCQHLEEMASKTHENTLDLIHKYKHEEQLNEKVDSEEPAAGQVSEEPAGGQDSEEPAAGQHL